MAEKLILNPHLDGLFYWLVQGTAHYGRFTEVARPTRLQHTWVSPNTHGIESLVTVTFRKQGDGTLMTLVHSGLPDTDQGRSHHKGWNFFLDGFREQLAKSRAAKYGRIRGDAQEVQRGVMKFILISRHTDGAEVPEFEKEKNLKDMGEWIALLNPELAMPIRGGTSVTAKRIEAYRGDVGGVIVYEADNLDQAVALAKKSPGLKYGFTHDVLPEMSLSEAAQAKVKCSS